MGLDRDGVSDLSQFRSDIAFVLIFPTKFHLATQFICAKPKQGLLHLDLTRSQMNKDSWSLEAERQGIEPWA